VGFPPTAPGWLRGHNKRVLVTVCEANRIPEDWVKAIRDANPTLIVVPSTFCFDAFVESGVAAESIIVVPHGVPATPALTENWLRVAFYIDNVRRVHMLHVSGALSFPQRKGTTQLLVAFKRIAASFPGVTLTLKVPQSEGLAAIVKHLGLEERVMLDTSPTIPPSELYQYLRQFDVVVQPSRGEGFGMVPLEARCAGVPVIMTVDTGHAMHHVPGVDVVVPTGPWTPMATQLNDIGMAPTVAPAAVTDALQRFLADVEGWQDRAREWSLRNARHWTWGRVLNHFSHKIAQLATGRHEHVLGEDRGLRGWTPPR